MNINKKNQADIEEKIYIHDSDFLNIQYNLNKQILKVDLDNSYLKKTFCISFQQVVFVQAQNFDFWGHGGNSVLDWDLSEDWNIIKLLFDNEYKRDGRYPEDESQAISEYIFSYFLLSSGNTLHVLCKEIEFTSTDYPSKLK